MSRCHRLAFALAASFAAASAVEAAPAPTKGVVMCGTPSPLRGKEALLCNTLQEIKETVGLRLRATPAPVTYRLFFGRSSSPDTPLVVLVELESPSQGTLTVRTLKRGEPADMPQAQIAALTGEDIKPVLDAAAASKFWELPVIAGLPAAQDVSEAPAATCPDGKPMVIEGLDRSRYHVAFGECAPADGLMTFERALAALAKRRFPDVKDPWMVEAAARNSPPT